MPRVLTDSLTHAFAMYGKIIFKTKIFVFVDNPSISIGGHTLINSYVENPPIYCSGHTPINNCWSTLRYKSLQKLYHALTPNILRCLGRVTSQATLARLGLGSGSARKKLGLGSAHELNKQSLSLNLGSINLELGRKKLGSGRRDASVAGTRLPPTVFGLQDLVFTNAIPTKARRSEMPKSCVPDIDVMDPQDLDPVDMDDKGVNPHEAVKEALTTKTTGARANPTPSIGGTVPRSPDLLSSGNGTHYSAKVSETVCSSVDSVKKVPANGTSGKDMDVGYDPLVSYLDN